MTILPLRLISAAFFDPALVFFVLGFLLITGSGLGSPSWASVQPIRYSLVPHIAQVPVVTGVALELKPGAGFCISRFSLHFMQ